MKQFESFMIGERPVSNLIFHVLKPNEMIENVKIRLTYFFNEVFLPKKGLYLEEKVIVYSISKIKSPKSKTFKCRGS